MIHHTGVTPDCVRLAMKGRGKTSTVTFIIRTTFLALKLFVRHVWMFIKMMGEMYQPMRHRKRPQWVNGQKTPSRNKPHDSSTGTSTCGGGPVVGAVGLILLVTLLVLELDAPVDRVHVTQGWCRIHALVVEHKKRLHPHLDTCIVKTVRDDWTKTTVHQTKNDTLDGNIYLVDRTGLRSDVAYILFGGGQVGLSGDTPFT